MIMVKLVKKVIFREYISLNKKFRVNYIFLVFIARVMLSIAKEIKGEKKSFKKSNNNLHLHKEE